MERSTVPPHLPPSGTSTPSPLHPTDVAALLADFDTVTTDIVIETVLLPRQFMYAIEQLHTRYQTWCNEQGDETA